MSSYAVNRIVIVGGGTAGWMTAAGLARHFAKTSIQLTVVDSSAIGTVGVGEATIPTLRRFYAELGMSDNDVLRQTLGTVKLGIEFRDWFLPGRRFIHPFGGFGQAANGVAFHHYWMKAKQLGSDCDLTDYSLGLQLAKHHKFNPPSATPRSELSIFDWALHFDAAKFAQLMRNYAVERGVTHIDNRITGVSQHPDGNISQLHLENGQIIAGDLFIDCSGFAGLLIDKTLHTPYISWSQWLRCDSAVAVQTALTEEVAPYTISQAHSGGWQWRIPLQHRQGNGMVFSSTFIDAAEAEKNLFNNLAGKPISEPKKFSFTPGRREKAWHKNCIAIGLASGFLEPLESTSIALVENAIEKIRRAFRHPFYTPADVENFNQLTAAEYERVRDFIILHYKANQRRGDPLWDYCRTMEIPDTLQKKIDTFVQTGDLIRYPVDMFGSPSWLAIFKGFAIMPRTIHPGVDRLQDDYLLASLKAMRQSIAQAVDEAPTHSQYLQDYCAV